MKITVLLENTKPEGREELDAEHGLSLHVADENAAFLFDTGASDLFRKNAETMGIDIAETAFCVLSHHHYDHGGGLFSFFTKTVDAPVYLGSSTATEFFFKALGGLLRKPIGLDPAIFEQYRDRLVFVQKESEIAPGLHVLTGIRHNRPMPTGNAKLFKQQDGKLIPDDFDHEIMLVREEKAGLVVFTGCSHSGILNMLDSVTARFPGKQIEALLGGFHLMGIPLFNSMADSPQEVRALGEKLLTYPVERYYTGHCTGRKAFAVLKDVMRDKLAYMATGDVIEV